MNYYTVSFVNFTLVAGASKLCFSTVDHSLRINQTGIDLAMSVQLVYDTVSVTTFDHFSRHVHLHPALVNYVNVYTIKFLLYDQTCTL